MISKNCDSCSESTRSVSQHENLLMCPVSSSCSRKQRKGVGAVVESISDMCTPCFPLPPEERKEEEDRPIGEINEMKDSCLLFLGVASKMVRLPLLSLLSVIPLNTVLRRMTANRRSPCLSLGSDFTISVCLGEVGDRVEKSS